MVPQIYIETQRAQISVETVRGRHEIERRQPDIKIETKRPVVTARNRPGDLVIDNTLTHNALTGGKMEHFWLNLYAQYKAVALKNLEKIVKDGNLMGDLRIRHNPIPDIALDEFIEGAPDLQVYGEARPDNTKIEYIPNDPDIQVDPGGVEIDVQLHRPDIRYHRGYVRVYMAQYPKVTIIPPPAIELMA
jgi:hypothetical protein